MLSSSLHREEKLQKITQDFLVVSDTVAGGLGGSASEV